MKILNLMIRVKEKDAEYIRPVIMVKVIKAEAIERKIAVNMFLHNAH